MADEAGSSSRNLKHLRLSVVDNPELLDEPILTANNIVSGYP